MDNNEVKKTRRFSISRTLFYLLLLTLGILGGLRLWNSGISHEEKQYQFYRKIADSLYLHKSFQDALNFYESALSYRPDDRYTLEQIKAVQANLDITFINTFGGAANDEGIGIALTNDAGYLMVGNTNSWGNGKSQGWIIKTDALGQLDRRQTIGNADDNFLQAMIPTKDGLFLAAGTTILNGKSHLWLVKINQDGRSLWEQTWGDDTIQVSGLAVAENTDSTLWVVGHIQVSDTSGTDAFVGHFDAGGNFLNYFIVGNKGADAAMAVGVVNDTTIALAGYTQEKLTVNTDGWFALMSNKGEVLRQTSSGGKSNDVFTSLAVLPDGRMTAAGHSQSYGNGSLDLWVVQFDATGKELWNKAIGGDGNDAARSILALFDGSFAIAGYTTSSGHGGKDIWLLKIHRNGAVDWKKELGDVEDDAANMLFVAPDGGYALCGYLTQKKNTELCIVKTNAKGEVSDMK